MDWSEAELGLLGSLDKFGMTLSSMVWGWALQLMPAKLLLVPGLLLNCISTFAFGTVRVKEVMFLAKVVMGITQGLQCVWSTCWVLTHAPAENRTTWLSLGAVFAGVGNGIGTAVAGFGTSQGLSYSVAWQIESLCLFLLWLVLVTFPSDSLAIEGASADAAAAAKDPAGDGAQGAPFETIEEEDDPFDDPRVQRSRLASDSGEGTDSEPMTGALSRGRRAETHGDLYSRERVRSIDDFIQITRSRGRASTCAGKVLVSKGTPERRRSSVIRASEAFPEARLCRARTATITNVGGVEAVAVEVTGDTFAQIRQLVRNPVYVLTAMALASILFVQSGIQFLWVRLFVAGWGLPKALVVSAFLVCTGSGGFLGVVYGPAAIDRCGGFGTALGISKSLRFIVYVVVVASAAAVASLAALAAKVVGEGAQLGSQHGLDAAVLVLWAAVFVIFAAFNATMAGLVGINISGVLGLAFR
eukprot:TRINITY_DN7617_c0_g1_i4.p1 TRINITY_DN7617_c0_g1~~TRINITY_DN7617_c0_g1_i4.p1  ORF type:complete len:537 (+),score=121.06 TRINITY_DN7617_c0_g1_i4:196-1611(+)